MAFGSMGDGDEDSPMSDINVTPLVDVMLVLLIVFMITMPVLTHSLQINLPVSSQKEQDKKQDDKSKKDILTIAVNKDGKYALGAESDKVVALDDLKARFTQIAAENPDQIIAISADKDAPYDFVLQVLQAARDAKLSKVAFNMEAKK
ncbi:ExbD/TolR family protein [Alysiella crassa]|uniref:Biopolymer transport protein exbD n=1 Tax=Alysiella crassa TaxID=153491 RepID=A0A376BV36_9NEIS|nr:biopolymer transporter ExbD [Alysiella crassa]UOP06205.1 biopolymer transporter ExbD [Alysiella crassa]SSY80683.1 Biopolymer transport protein exbD [Alysiella crassa]